MNHSSGISAPPPPPPPHPKTDPKQSAHSLCAREGVPPASLKKLGSSVKFMRPRRSGAGATLFFLSWISLVPPKR
ncbi:hypothetical protein HID58_042892 [Brassica napus]|uniref:Uncharacterized protein n=1 Tax=Brassica napus TaxID=3708 RepID=A0ABQ8BF08_BRANA|nr:hypothetical protein HID58_042892 [Brassica napus]